MLDKFEIQVGSGKTHLLAQLEAFLLEHQAFFDRFIFIYLPNDWQIFLPFFHDNLSDKYEQKKKEILSPLLFSSFPQNLIDRSSVKSSSLLFNFIEDQDRIIQLIGFSYDQFLEHVSPHVLDEIPTCIVLLNIDQVCYDSSKFIQVVTTFLPKLSKWCAYLGLTKHELHTPFYHYLARSLGKNPVFKTETYAEVPHYDSWTFTTLLKGVSNWIGDPSIPKKFYTAMQRVRDGLPDLSSFFSNSSVEDIQRTIQSIKKEAFGANNWEKYRQFAYALFLGEMFSRHSDLKFLIITKSFNQRSWKKFQMKMRFPEYDSDFTPQFRSLSQLERMPITVIEQFDHLILDIGDEITEWESVPLLINILEKVKSLKSYLPSKPVTFFHPYLITSDAMKWLLINPPIPLSLAQLPASVRTSELVYRTILLTTLQRLTKRDFYQNIRASWLQVQHDLDSNTLLADEVKYLRSIGLLDRVHYHTTVLGRFFLDQQLSIVSFLKFLKKHVPGLFEQALSEHMSPPLFIQFFHACAAWYYYEKPDNDFNDLEWVQFRRKVNESGKIQTFPEEIEDNINNMISGLRLIESSKKQFKVHKHSQPSLKKPLLEKIEYRTRKPSKALIWALHDILQWLKTFKREITPIPSTPYFLVRQHARTAAWYKEAVSEASYIRAIRRIFDEKYSPTDKYFVQQPSIPRYEQAVPHVVRRLRCLLKTHYIRLTNNRGSQIVMFSSTATQNWKSIMNFPWNFEYLDHTCKECLYFNAKRKRHCTLLPLFKDDEDLPKPCSNRTSIDQSPVFSSMVGCPIWRPKRSIIKESGQLLPKFCYHCFQKLVRVKGQQQIVCHCGTEYQLLRNNQTQKFEGFTYQLTTQYEKFQEIALLFPDYEVKIDPKEEPIEVPAEHRFPAISNEEFLLLTASPHCLQLKASDKLGYSQDLDRLEITNKMGKVRYVKPSKVKLIDTSHMNEELLEFKQKHPHVELNHRTERLTLSRKDTVHIKQHNNLIPVLQVTRKRTRAMKHKPRKRRRKRVVKHEKSKYYPLNKIFSVFNVGKPRLNQTLKQYGVSTIYASTRGITTDPIETIEEALTLEGVRQTLSEIHLLGLVVSVLRASAQLVGITYHLDQPTLGDQIAAQVKGLLMRSPYRLYQHYQPFRLGYHPSVRQQCRFEGWIFKPFAEGLRELIVSLPSKKLGGLLDNIRQQKKPREGRNVTRRVEKKNKKERDFYGGYSPFDAALNSIHRSMRYQLRLKNARIGFGFNTKPIFSHQAHDKPGRSGHLDLEEVARILSRFVVLEGFRTHELRKIDFEVCPDDNNFPYYVPYYRALTKIRSTFIYQKLFATPIHYDNRWLPLEEAHRVHVRHLRKCLEECNHLNSEQTRQTHLLNTYQPLIFHVKPFSQQVSDIQEKLFYLMNYNWVERTQKLWKRLGVDPQFMNHFLFKPELVERISLI
ncbi:MAG: hypothetical protein ACXADY_02265 [Candidatus Hodarchaeales archaeon]|jgi:hypothetical protein